jgi:hypothetical protein
MTVDQVYNILKFIVRKNQLGSLPPLEFEYAFNTAQRNYYDFLVGRIEQYQYGRPVPRVGLNMTDNVVTRLMPFQIKSTVAITSGILTKPGNLNKISAIYTANNYRIYRIEENRFAERIQDSIDPIDEANAFYIEEKSTLRVYPTTLTTCSLVYFTTPTDVKWNYTIDGSGRPVYNPTGSIQPIWLENDYDELIARAAKIIGVSLKDATPTQYGQQVIQTGE